MSRLHIETRDGIQILEGPCEGCGQKTKIAWDESIQRYLCVSCIESKDTPVKGHAFRTSKAEPYPIAVNGHNLGSNANLNPKDTFLSKYFRFAH